MTICTCDTFLSTTTSNALTASNSSSGTALAANASTGKAIFASSSTTGPVVQVNGTGASSSTVYVAPGTGSTYGLFVEGGNNAILGKTYVSTVGVHVAGVIGQYAGTQTDCSGVIGEAINGGGNYGVRGIGHTFGSGIKGEADGGGEGGFFSANANVAGYTSYGVWGQVAVSTGNHSSCGVYGYATGGSGTTAVFGDGGSPGSGINAGYFRGDVTVTGYLSKSGGGFKIDHPADPENKFLYHGFVESAKMTNMYRGKVTLDAKGNAEVTLPSYYDSINENGDVTFAPVGISMPNLSVSEIVDGKFTINGGVDGAKVNWLVVADRADAWAKNYQPNTEVNKEEHEKGKFLNPEIYGHTKEKGINHPTRGNK